MQCPGSNLMHLAGHVAACKRYRPDNLGEAQVGPPQESELKLACLSLLTSNLTTESGN